MQLFFLFSLHTIQKKEKNSLRFNHKVERKIVAISVKNVVWKKWSKRRNQFLECSLKLNSIVYIQNCTKSLKQMVFVKREKKIFTPLKTKVKVMFNLKWGVEIFLNIIMLISICKRFFFSMDFRWCWFFHSFGKRCDSIVVLSFSIKWNVWYCCFPFSL